MCQKYEMEKTEISGELPGWMDWNKEKKKLSIQNRSSGDNDWKNFSRRVCAGWQIEGEKNKCLIGSMRLN